MMSRLISGFAGVVLATAAATNAPAQEPVGQVAATVPKYHFLDVNALALFRMSPEPFQIYRTGGFIDILNASDLEFNFGFGIQGALGGTFGNTPVGYLFNGFYSSPMEATFSDVFPEQEVFWAAAGGGDTLDSIFAVGVTGLWGASGNLLLRASPAVALYLGPAYIRLNDSLYHETDNGIIFGVEHSALNSLLGGQLGARLSFGGYEAGQLFFNADIRVGLMRNSITRNSDIDYNLVVNSPANYVANSWMLAGDVAAGFQFTRNLALTLGYHPLFLTNVALAAAQDAELQYEGDNEFVFLDPILRTFFAQGITIGLELGY